MFKRIVLVLLAVVALLSGGIIGYIYFNQDILKNKLIAVINAHLKVPVDVASIEISPLTSFPDASVTLNNLKIIDPYDKNNFFATAKLLSFSFNVWDLLQGEAVLEQIDLEEGTLNIIQHTEENWSYHIYKEPKRKIEKQLKFNIDEMNITSLTTVYLSKIHNNSWKGNVSSAKAGITINGPVTWVDLSTSIFSEELKVHDFSTLQRQDITYNGEIIIDKHWQIKSSILKVGNSIFNLTINKNDEHINAFLASENTDIKSLLNLAPSQVNKRLNNYNSTGNISFDTKLTHTFSTGVSKITSGLIFNNVDIHQEGGIIKLNSLNLEGSLNIPDISDLNSSSLRLFNIVGSLNGKGLHADLKINNFTSPFLKGSFNGELPLPFLKDLSGYNINEPKGNINVNISVEGLLSDFKDSPKLIKTSGELNMDHLEFYLPGRIYPITLPGGNIIFNNAQLAINDLELNMGGSNFKINGQVHNYWNIASNNRWSATADVHSKTLFLDELLSIQDDNPKSDFYTFHIPENISLELNASVGSFRIRQFSARDASGIILVRDEKLSAEKISFNAMGGMVKLKGQWHDLNANGSAINLSFLFAGIAADSLFYSFENFNQDFITNKNLSGRIYASAETSLKLDSNLIVLPNTLIATLDTRIMQGELKDFAPLYGLEKYLDNADLSSVRFSELENKIIVKNSSVFLPMMAVGTNVVKFKIGGLHSFDQFIDYDVVAPLIRRRKTDSDARFGQVKDDQHGESLVFLSIKGTTQNFEVSLDKTAIKKEIASDVQREVKELQDAFKNNGKATTTEVELEEDDYFDWDN